MTTRRTQPNDYSANSPLKVPLVKPDLPDFETVAGVFKEIMQSGRITNFGKYVCQFEQEAGSYLGTHVVSVSSGTTGLIFAMQALGLKPGEKVAVPSFTFVATAQAILYAGGVPHFVEVSEDLTLSADDLDRQLARHDIALVVPVHVYGLPCQTDGIETVVQHASRRAKRVIPVVYDAAHAFGSAVNDMRIGSFGNCEVFSLSVTKALVSVEGGIIASQDFGLIEHIRKMRNYGIEENYEAHWPGMNAKMSEFHGIIGLYNLRRLGEVLEERQRKARYYLGQIRTYTGFHTLRCPQGITHTFKDFTVLMPEAMAGRRDAVRTFLAQRGIETKAYFDPPVHEQLFFRPFADRPLPRTEVLARRVITLPFYTAITQEEMDYVVQALAEAERKLT